MHNIIDKDTFLARGLGIEEIDSEADFSDVKAPRHLRLGGLDAFPHEFDALSERLDVNLLHT